MGVFREPSPREIRARIESIPDVFRVPAWDRSVKVNGVKIRSLDKFLFLTGCRVSEAVAKQGAAEKAIGLNFYGNELEYTVADYHGEEVAIWSIKTLKRKDQLTRSVALPLNPEYEPWTREIINEWKNGNPWDITRSMAGLCNRQIFDGLKYTVLRRKEPKPIRDHGLRHIRIKQLVLEYGFTPIEVQRWCGWTAGSLKGQGVNPMMDQYFSLGWQDYIQKLLRKPYN